MSQHLKKTSDGGSNAPSQNSSRYSYDSRSSNLSNQSVGIDKIHESVTALHQPEPTSTPPSTPNPANNKQLHNTGPNNPPKNSMFQESSKNATQNEVTNNAAKPLPNQQGPTNVPNQTPNTSNPMPNQQGNVKNGVPNTTNPLPNKQGPGYVSQEGPSNVTKPSPNQQQGSRGQPSEKSNNDSKSNKSRPTDPSVSYGPTSANPQQYPPAPPASLASDPKYAAAFAQMRRLSQQSDNDGRGKQVVTTKIEQSSNKYSYLTTKMEVIENPEDEFTEVYNAPRDNSFSSQGSKQSGRQSVTPTPKKHAPRQAGRRFKDEAATVGSTQASEKYDMKGTSENPSAAPSNAPPSETKDEDLVWMTKLEQFTIKFFNKIFRRAESERKLRNAVKMPDTCCLSNQPGGGQSDADRDPTPEEIQKEDADLACELNDMLDEIGNVIKSVHPAYLNLIIPAFATLVELKSCRDFRKTDNREIFTKIDEYDSLLKCFPHPCVSDVIARVQTLIEFINGINADSQKLRAFPKIVTRCYSTESKICQEICEVFNEGKFQTMNIKKICKPKPKSQDRPPWRLSFKKGDECSPKREFPQDCSAPAPKPPPSKEGHCCGGVKTKPRCGNQNRTFTTKCNANCPPLKENCFGTGIKWNKQFPCGNRNTCCQPLCKPARDEATCGPPNRCCGHRNRPKRAHQRCIKAPPKCCPPGAVDREMMTMKEYTDCTTSTAQIPQPEPTMTPPSTPNINPFCGSRQMMDPQASRKNISTNTSGVISPDNMQYPMEQGSRCISTMKSNYGANAPSCMSRCMPLEPSTSNAPPPPPTPSAPSPPPSVGSLPPPPVEEEEEEQEEEQEEEEEEEEEQEEEEEEEPEMSEHTPIPSPPVTPPRRISQHSDTDEPIPRQVFTAEIEHTSKRLSWLVTKTDPIVPDAQPEVTEVFNAPSETSFSSKSSNPSARPSYTPPPKKELFQLPSQEDIVKEETETTTYAMYEIEEVIDPPILPSEPPPEPIDELAWMCKLEQFIVKFFNKIFRRAESEKKLRNAMKPTNCCCMPNQFGEANANVDPTLEEIQGDVDLANELNSMLEEIGKVIRSVDQSYVNLITPAFGILVGLKSKDFRDTDNRQIFCKIDEYESMVMCNFHICANSVTARIQMIIDFINGINADAQVLRPFPTILTKTYSTESKVCQEICEVFNDDRDFQTVNIKRMCTPKPKIQERPPWRLSFKTGDECFPKKECTSSCPTSKHPQREGSCGMKTKPKCGSSGNYQNRTFTGTKCLPSCPVPAARENYLGNGNSWNRPGGMCGRREMMMNNSCNNNNFTAPTQLAWPPQGRYVGQQGNMNMPMVHGGSSGGMRGVYGNMIQQAETRMHTGVGGQGTDLAEILRTRAVANGYNIIGLGASQTAANPQQQQEEQNTLAALVGYLEQCHFELCQLKKKQQP